MLKIPVPQVTEQLVDVPKIDRSSGPSFAVRQESDSRGSRAADDKTVGGCAQDRASRQNPAMASERFVHVPILFEGLSPGQFSTVLR